MIAKIESLVSAEHGGTFAVTPFNAGVWVGCEGMRFTVFRTTPHGFRFRLGEVTLTHYDLDAGTLSFWPCAPFERGDEIDYIGSVLP